MGAKARSLAACRLSRPEELRIQLMALALHLAESCNLSDGIKE